ncbi:MAG: hypothetical protein OEW15_18835 [Nitrospirota bacterium]|nr:hypothetical protein [Nitrospirota bacterium]
MSALKPYQNRILVLLTQQELLIAELYRFFSSLYPETREFWDDAAKEEMEHAGWVEYLYAKAQASEVYFREEQMKTYTVESFVKYLEDNLAKVKQKAPTLQAAFSLALNIENSLIVKKLFDRFHSDHQELTILLRRLQDDMGAHRKRIEKMAAAYPQT